MTAFSESFDQKRSTTRGVGKGFQRPWLMGFAAAGVWFGTSAITLNWPDLSDWERSRELGGIEMVIGAVLGMVAILSCWSPRADLLRPAGAWLIAIASGFSLWELITAKLGILPLPFFVPPQSVLEVFLDDWPRLGESLYRSVALLVPAYLIGGSAGFVLGLSIGWSRAVAYWGQPILRFIGPLPATAWLPLALFFFPSSWSASTFLIALAAGFPVAILTASGVAGVNTAFYDIARTLGAKRRFLVLKVAVPAAMPHVFVGLFMGLGGSIAVLVVAEMLGVKAGLGFYIQWAQGWSAYNNMYAALIVMALLFSGLISLLFLIRDRLLAWQKGLVRW